MFVTYTEKNGCLELISRCLTWDSHLICLVVISRCSAVIFKMLKFAEINILDITIEHLDITIGHIRWLSHS